MRPQAEALGPGHSASTWGRMVAVTSSRPPSAAHTDLPQPGVPTEPRAHHTPHRARPPGRLGTRPRACAGQGDDTMGPNVSDSTPPVSYTHLTLPTIYSV